MGLAQLVARVGAAVQLDDLAHAATALAQRPERPENLYGFGYACIEHGLAFAAVPALREGLRLAPGSRDMLTELVSALEREGRHVEAVDVLASRPGTLPDWPERYLLAYNALMMGDLDRAGRQYEQLAPPDDERWLPAQDRLGRALARGAVARGASPLDLRDLRGWHFVVSGGVLCMLSPYAFDSGMTGRWAYVAVTPSSCRAGLLRLRLMLTGRAAQPTALSSLPDRDSQILGAAAARILDLPVVPFQVDRPDTVVVAYDLTSAAEDLQVQLRERARGQVLYEHATRWTDPPAVAADVCGLLAQVAVAPWHERPRLGADMQPSTAPADERAVEVVAEEIADAGPDVDTGDGETPPDPDSALAAFATAVADQWMTGGTREAPKDTGPVRSSRFI